MTIAVLLLIVFCSLTVLIEEVDAGDSVPYIYMPITTQRTWKQFSKIMMKPVFGDNDAGDILTISVNMNTSIQEKAPITAQLPYITPVKGTDWDLNETSGNFWMQLDDQNIWWNGTSMPDEVNLTIAFMVEDQDGNNASTTIDLVLKDENQEPEKPDKIFYSPSQAYQGENVTFWVDEVSDPEYDTLTYKWDFGDGATAEGIEVVHPYVKNGYKTVQMWVEDQEFMTEKISLRIEILERDTNWTMWDDDDDGVLNGNDAFPSDPAASVDTDGDGYPDSWNEGFAENMSTTGLKLDVFPNDPNEWADTDRDGVGDRSDKFPNDPAASIDSDLDGSPDSWNPYMNAENSTTGLHIDAFPFDYCASVDTDGDGYPDQWNSNLTIEELVTNLTLDAFPYDPTEWNDTDGDGYGDNSDVFPSDPSEWYDSDNDSYGNNVDAFPYDPNEWVDTDEDGVGDNSDAFPNDPNEWNDTDGDSFGDNSDAFPNDPAASIDSDHDGYPDTWNPGMSQEDSTTGLQLDRYPNDRGRALPTGEKFPFIFMVLVLIGALILIAVILSTILIVRKRMKNDLSDDKRELRRYLRDTSDEDIDIKGTLRELRTLKRDGKINGGTYNRTIGLVGGEQEENMVLKGKI